MANPTVADFLNAYEKTGIQATQKEYYVAESNCGCPVAAYAIAQGVEATEDVIIYWVLDSDNYSYFSGVMRGFDGVYIPDQYTTEEERQGYFVGNKVRDIMFGQEVRDA